jgi:predicted amidohydrolase YtcJ
MLDRVDVHCIWVSEAVLSLLPSPFPTIPGGEVITDPGPGVFCDNAMDLVMQYWPKPNKTKRIEFVKAAHKALNAVGLVGVHDAGVLLEDLGLYQELVDTQDWTVRVYAMLQCKKRDMFCGHEVEKFSHDKGMLSMKSVKLFAGEPLYSASIIRKADICSDGALGSWGSAMIEPYSDKPWTTGSLIVNASTLTKLTRDWSQAGYQVNIHAIGDLANRYTIDAFEAAYPSLCAELSAKECQAQHRFRIEHAQIIHPDDQKRMFEMGIIPSIQPTHATSDMVYAEDRLGSKRTNEEAYRMRSLLPLEPILGSDFPIEPPNPFEGIFAAIARRSPKTGLGKGGNQSGWHTEEALDLEDALRGFTLGPAHGAFLDGKAGIIKKGAYADWIVLDEPLEDMRVDDIRHVRVRETWVGGRCVYRLGEERIDRKDEL